MEFKVFPCVKCLITCWLESRIIIADGNITGNASKNINDITEESICVEAIFLPELARRMLLRNEERRTKRQMKKFVKPKLTKKTSIPDPHSSSSSTRDH